ncbi:MULTISPECIES: hypothetical protein [unclassified Nonomuraea]|uniref:hypothetical protein n=1 Tax=unclassified Nonomuraea TaxID=2593643 RepID=UPI0033F01A27
MRTTLTPEKLTDLAPADRERFANDLEFLVDRLEGVALAEAVVRQMQRFGLA